MLKAQLLKGKSIEPEEAWSAISLFLCAPPTERYQQSAYDMAHESLNSISYQAGIPGEEMTESSPDREQLLRWLADGHAWNAHLDVVPDQVQISYFADAATVKGLTLSYRDNHCQLTDVSEASD